MSGLRKLIPSANALLVFEAAARLRSFKAAAEELNVTQPNVSHSIKAMEAHLGTQLFERNNRGVELTRAGAELMVDLSPALQQIEHRLRTIADRKAHTITIAASTSASAQWLLPITAQFQRAHPGIRVRILTTDRNVEPGDGVDMTIRRGPANWGRPHCWHISDEIIYAMCSMAYLEKSRPLHGLDDLKHHAIIHNAEPYRRRMQWDEWLRHQGYVGEQLPETLILNDYQLVIQACIAGEGIALGWSFTTQKLIEQRILVKPLGNQLVTGHAFYVLGDRHVEQSRSKMLYIDWISSK